MKWKIEKVIDTTYSDPNVIGEYLRERFFLEAYKTVYGTTCRKLGCYEEFRLADDIEMLPSEIDANDNVWVRAKSPDGVIMTYMWDGDGVLAFLFPDNTIVYNTDCKKTYRWEYEDNASRWVLAWMIDSNV